MIDKQARNIKALRKQVEAVCLTNRAVAGGCHPKSIPTIFLAGRALTLFGYQFHLQTTQGTACDPGNESWRRRGAPGKTCVFVSRDQLSYCNKHVLSLCSLTQADLMLVQIHHECSWSVLLQAVAQKPKLRLPLSHRPYGPGMVKL